MTSPDRTAAAAPESAAGRHRRRLTIVLALTGGYLLVELVGGIVTGSLALIADAAHMGTDVFALALALFAIWLGGRPATPERTYGYYRAEILAAAVNAAALFAVSGYILYEAWRRFQEPPEVQSLPMLAVAAVGLAVNLHGVWLLRRGAGESLNVEGAYLEVLADLLSSLGVLAAGGIMLLTGWWYADPLVSVAIGLFIVPRTWRLLREAVGVLLEGTPPGLDLAQVRAAMAAVPGVRAVHDLHVWSITSGYAAMSGHVQVDAGTSSADRTRLLSDLSALLRERFGIAHPTIQIEDPGFEEDERHA
jgi:cobalt-zinc-cadmium efflux system protein